jgi:hypothetical protein
MPLTDTQLLLLSAASQREDLLLVPPENLTGKAAGAASSKLLRRDLIAEVVLRRDEPHWREDDGLIIGFKLTPAGLQAIGIAPDEEGSPQQPAEPTPAPNILPLSPSPPREGSKKALILLLLQQDGGATLQDLASATGWLPHTTRAALTRLRQTGTVITRETRETGQSVYWIAPTADPGGNEATAENVA